MNHTYKLQLFIQLHFGPIKMICKSVSLSNSIESLLNDLIDFFNINVIRPFSWQRTIGTFPPTDKALFCEAYLIGNDNLSKFAINKKSTNETGDTPFRLSVN